MFRFLFVFLFIVLPITVVTKKITVSTCGGHIKEVRAFGCVNDTEPCAIQRGSSGRMELDFEAPFNVRYLYADVRGRTGSQLFPVWVSWPGLHKDACDGHGISCPLRRGKTYTYVYEMLITKDYEPLQTESMVKLTNALGFTVVCFRMPVQIS